MSTTVSTATNVNIPAGRTLRITGLGNVHVVDGIPGINGSDIYVNPNRVWRSGNIGSLGANIILTPDAGQTLVYTLSQSQPDRSLLLPAQATEGDYNAVLNAAKTALKDPDGVSDIVLGGIVDGVRQNVLAVMGVSLERLASNDIGKRYDIQTAQGSWANGVGSLTSAAHGITVGTSFLADIYDHSGGSWTELAATVTASDANTFTVQLATNPGAVATVVAVDIRLDKGVPLTSITWAAGVATLTLPFPLGLNAYAGADFRIELSNVRDSNGNLIPEYDAVIACAPTGFTASNVLTFYNANDPGVAAASGTIAFVPQILASSNGWIQATNSALGMPFSLRGMFAVGGATPITVVNELPNVLAMNPLPTHCLIGGVENDATITATELYRTAGRKLRAAGIQPILFDARPVGLFAGSAVAFDSYQKTLAVMCAQEGFLLMSGGNVYQRAGTTPVADAYADTAWRKVPPTIDSTHDSRCGAYLLAGALSKSDGGSKLKSLARRQFAMLGGETAGNLLPNPMFLTPSGGTAVGGGTGTMPLGWQIFGDNSAIVVVPIKRAAPRKWMPGMGAVVGDVVFALTQMTQWLYVAFAAGNASTTTEPTWPTAKGGTVVDGTITWRAIKADACDGGPGYWLSITVPRPTPLSITGVTQANPGVVTVGAVTGLANNRRVYIDGVGGMTQLNDRIWSMNSLGASTFNLLRDDTNGNASTAAFSAYTAGGVCVPFTSVTMSLTTALTKSGSAWNTRDRLKLGAEVVYEDIEAIRGAIVQMAWLGGTSSSEQLGSALASQGYPLDHNTIGGEFMAPREMTAAAQTLNTNFIVNVLSGTFRIASPRLENQGAW